MTDKDTQIKKTGKTSEAENDENKYDGYIPLEHTFTDRFADEEVTVKHHFKKPNRPQISRAQKGINKDAMKAYNTFLTDIIHPDEKTKLAENIKKYPGVSATFGNAVMSAVGVGELGN